MIFKKGDILFYLTFIILMGYIYYPDGDIESNMIEIIYNSEIIDNLDSSIDSTYLYNSSNYHFSISIQNGKVNIVKPSCKDKLCTKIGPIKRGENSTIVCLPQKVVVRFKASSDNQLDGIAG